MDSHREQSSETECEALTAGAPGLSDLVVEIQSIVDQLESDLREGRGAECRCADDLHRLRLRAERLFPET